MPKQSKRIRSSSSCSIHLPALLAEMEASVERAFEDEGVAANSNGVVPNCQPSPDELNVPSDEDDELSDTTTIPTIESTLQYGDLSFLHNKFLLDDKNYVTEQKMPTIMKIQPTLHNYLSSK